MSSADEPLWPREGPMRHLRVLQSLDRNWGFLLSVYEGVLLRKIVDVTVGWNRDDYSCSLASLISGKTADGEVRAWPVPISLPQAERALKRLRDLGLVKTRRHQTGNVFSVNGLFIVAEGIRQVEAMGIPVSKREKAFLTQNPLSEGSEPSTRGNCPISQRDQNHLSDGYRIIRSIYSGKDNQDSGSANASPQPVLSADQVLRDKIAQTSSENQSKRSKKVSTAAEKIDASTKHAKGKDPGRVKPADLWEVWSAAHGEKTGPKAWTVKDKVFAEQLFNRWSDRNGLFSDFLRWVAGDWKSVIAGRFGWMKERKVPDMPEIGFVNGFANIFFDAYVSRSRDTAANDLKLNAFAQMIAKGMDPNEAIAMAEKAAVDADRRARGAKAPPAAPPVVRTRTRPLHPVATERGLPDRQPRPTHLPPDVEEAMANFKPRRIDFGDFE